MDPLTEANRDHYSEWSMNPGETRLRVAEGLIAQEKPGRLLDVASSGGEFSSRFIEKGWKVWGMDISVEKVEQAKERGIQAGLADVCKPLLECEGIEKDSFDLVFAGEIIEHLVDTDDFLLNVASVLKPGGKLVLTTPNLLSFENRLRMLFGRYPHWVDWSLTSSSTGHVRAYSGPVLRKQLVQNGYKVEALRGNYVPILRNQFLFLDDRRQNWVRFTGKLFPSLSGTLIAKARKL